MKLLPIILIIIFAIVVTTYQDEIIAWLDDTGEQAAETVADKVVPDFLRGEGDTSETEKEGVNLTINSSDQTYAITAELAQTQEERLEGLMYRDDLCDDCGMLFVFDSDVQGGFWMLNCLIPLDILFINEDGVIVDIKENFEPCPAHPCPSYEPDSSYRYALEVNGGWVNEHEVNEDDTVDIPSI